MNGTSRRSGDLGEVAAIAMLEQRGWKLIERQAKVLGLRIDALMFDPDANEVLVQVKAWQPGNSGRDTVKKDIHDAWQLRRRGEQRAIVLVLTEPMRGILRESLLDALAEGFYTRVLIINVTELTP
jgi:hypothetical protein